MVVHTAVSIDDAIEDELSEVLLRNCRTALDSRHDCGMGVPPCVHFTSYKGEPNDTSYMFAKGSTIHINEMYVDSPKIRGMDIMHHELDHIDLLRYPMLQSLTYKVETVDELNAYFRVWILAEARVCTVFSAEQYREERFIRDLSAELQNEIENRLSCIEPPSHCNRKTFLGCVRREKTRHINRIVPAVVKAYNKKPALLHQPNAQDIAQYIALI